MNSPSSDFRFQAETRMPHGGNPPTSKNEPDRSRSRQCRAAGRRRRRGREPGERRALRAIPHDGRRRRLPRGARGHVLAVAVRARDGRALRENEWRRCQQRRGGRSPRRRARVRGRDFRERSQILQRVRWRRVRRDVHGDAARPRGVARGGAVPGASSRLDSSFPTRARDDAFPRVHVAPSGRPRLRVRRQERQHEVRDRANRPPRTWATARRRSWSNFATTRVGAGIDSSPSRTRKAS